MTNMLALGVPMGAEWIVIALLGLLIFGKRLPEVGKSLGQGIVQFKKGLKGVEEEIEQVDVEAPAKRVTDQTTPASVLPVAPADAKFDPYTGKPIEAVKVETQPKFDPYTGKPIVEETEPT